jgi:TPR repeat protein
MHCTGEGVAVDLEEAVRLYAAAAESGHVEAMYNLGVMQMKGMGTEADPEKGMAWVRTAASNGLKAAQAIVGGAESAAR